MRLVILFGLTEIASAILIANGMDGHISSKSAEGLARFLFAWAFIGDVRDLWG